MKKFHSVINNRHGSSAVFLALCFLAFAICIAGSIVISRRLTVMSECEAFGRVWTRAVLSEYDRHLLEDYRLMAFWGNEIEVDRKIEDYLDYSVEGKLGIDLDCPESDLSGYELGDPDNFSNALEHGALLAAADSLKNSTFRKARDGVPNESSADDNNGTAGVSGSNSSGRAIGNTVVLDTLPSGGAGSSLSTDTLVKRARSTGDEEGVWSAAASAGAEMAFIWKYFGSCITVPDSKPHYFTNEIEYVIKGNTSDDKNYEACRKSIFLMRNVLNLASLYRDPVKTELIETVSQLISPGPLGLATQAILAEAWAAAETENDLDILYDNGRVPVLKTGEQWQTDLDSVLAGKEVRQKLDEESRELLDAGRHEISGIPGIGQAGRLLKEGLSYDDHLLLMMMCMKPRTRLLRVMDVVQINMKYRYYRDFNLMEYYTGVRYAITADGRNYEFEDHYK